VLRGPHHSAGIASRMTEQKSSPGILDRWHAIPLYLRILGGVVLGVLVGVLAGPRAGFLEIPSKLVLRLLGALAAPLILLAVVQALLHAHIPKGSAFQLVRLLILNTLVAIFIGLFVANVIQPGRWTTPPTDPEHQTETAEQVIEKPTTVKPAEKVATVAGATGQGIAPETVVPVKELASKETGSKEPAKKPVDPAALFLDNIPKSLLGPLGDEGKVIAVILLALAFGIALRRVKHESVATVADLVSVGFQVLVIMLHWVIEVIPLAVFGIVASIIGKNGFAAFQGLLIFVVAVLVALFLQVVYYLARIRMGSWVRPIPLLGHMRDALVMAFSTASSTATMPLTYARLRERVGLRERSASLGALVGANFNNDGTALYEAMAALFISQLIGVNLTLFQQFLVVLTSVAASVGAAGIPEAGIVTMTLVFNAVGLPISYIPILLAVDWFLDRCRTVVNVMGDVNVSCLLDGKVREHPGELVPEA